MDAAVGAEGNRCRQGSSNAVMNVHSGEATSQDDEGTENYIRNSMTMTSSTTTAFLQLRSASHCLRKAFLSRLGTFVAFVALFSTSVVAQGDLVFNTPETLIVCTPTNLTWSGGIAPYRLNIAPFDSATKETVPSLNQRFTNINTHFFSWTANFTPETTVNFNLVDATASQPMSLNQTVMTGSNTSCLPKSVTGTQSSVALITSAPTNTDSAFPTDPAGSPMQHASDQEVQHGLSAGAIAGIAVGVGAAAIIVGAITVWCFLRRKHQIRGSRRYSGFDVDRSVVVTPALSEDSTAVMHESRFSGISSALYKSGVVGSPVEATFMPYSGPSSPMHEHDDPLRPTPYLVPRSSSPSGSLSDLRRSAARKSARDVYGGAVGSTNVSTADVRSATPTPTVPDLPALPTMGGLGGLGASPPARSPTFEPVPLPLGSPRAAHVRFETDGGVRLEAGEDVAGNGVGSDGGATLPPPYSERYERSPE
ncbi:hypothetical protein C8Q80DRAFT_1267003 [Daedaleopsis nitida]|nr:hypothetical protein C8Q80DRAFT_1267003 [Daedaleopsis nitida]